MNRPEEFSDLTPWLLQYCTLLPQALRPDRNFSYTNVTERSNGRFCVSRPDHEVKTIGVEPSGWTLITIPVVSSLRRCLHVELLARGARIEIFP
jgi:hypothetical protein